jgi:RNA polymerase sigma-70 factor (ECF subfamily)
MNAEQSESIEQLYLEMFNMLLSYARASLEEESLAEEAVQETFQIACWKPEQLLGSPNPKGWLVNALKYTISDIKRSRETTRQLLFTYLTMQTSKLAISENTISLEVMYGSLADTEEFKLLKEMAIDGMSYLEMATARGISVNACKKRIQRAREKLQEKLKFNVTK